MDLDSVANLRPVNILNKPFRHLVLEGFLKEDTYAALCDELASLKSKGLCADIDKSCLSQFPGYDAYCYVFPPDCRFPLSLFYTQDLKHYIELVPKVTVFGEGLDPGMDGVRYWL